MKKIKFCVKFMISQRWLQILTMYTENRIQDALSILTI